MTTTFKSFISEAARTKKIGNTQDKGANDYKGDAETSVKSAGEAKKSKGQYGVHDHMADHHANMSMHYRQMASKFPRMKDHYHAVADALESLAAKHDSQV